MSQGSQLSSTIPTIRAMQQNRSTFFINNFSNLNRARKDQFNIRKPMSLIKKIIKIFIILKSSFTKLLKLIVAIAHDMNIINRKELQFAVLVATRGRRDLFVAHAHRLIGNCVRLGSRIEQIQCLLVALVRQANVVHQGLVRLASGVCHANAGLRAASNCRCVRVEVCQYRHSPFGAEREHFFQLLVAYFRWNDDFRWICAAVGVFLVDVGDSPQLCRYFHPLILVFDVECRF